jgi:hypothetical protein
MTYNLFIHSPGEYIQNFLKTKTTLKEMTQFCVCPHQPQPLGELKLHFVSPWPSNKSSNDQLTFSLHDFTCPGRKRQPAATGWKSLLLKVAAERVCIPALLAHLDLTALLLSHARDRSWWSLRIKGHELHLYLSKQVICMCIYIDMCVCVYM